VKKGGGAASVSGRRGEAAKSPRVYQHFVKAGKNIGGIVRSPVG